MVKDYQSTCIYNISSFPLSFNIYLAFEVFRCLCILKSWFSLHQVVAIVTDMNINLNIRTEDVFEPNKLFFFSNDTVSTGL